MVHNSKLVGVIIIPNVNQEPVTNSEWIRFYRSSMWQQIDWENEGGQDEQLFTQVLRPTNRPTINQSTNHPTNQSTDQPANQPTIRLTNG